MYEIAFTVMVDIRHRHKRVVNHIRKHHKKYLVWWFGLFWAIKAMIFVLWLIPAMIWNYHVKAAMSNTILYQTAEQAWVIYIDTQWNEFEMWTITYTDTWWDSITILDRNLWAIERWTWVNSYWYHFQWWNNYWFQNDITPKISSTKVDTNNYSWTNPYISDVFITASAGWETNTTSSLWWWNWEYDYMRQWPCPAWYHVPTLTEISTLYNLFWNNVTSINENLYIPYWGIRRYGAGAPVDYLWTNAYLWSSTIYANLSSYYYKFSKWAQPSNTVDARSYWFSVRCFADTTPNEVILSFETNWWQKIQWQSVPLNWTAHVIWYDPVKDGYTFWWWYKDEEFTQPFQFGVDVVTEDTTIYAKWTDKPRCQNQWTQYNWVVWNCEEWTITVTNESQSITIKDMNVWATTVWYGEDADMASYWLYYQWWWMTGYDYSLTPVQAINLWFVTNNGDWVSITSWWTKDQQTQLCGEWYHIPTSGEIKNILDMYTMNGNNLSKFDDAFKIPFAGRRNYSDAKMGIPGLHVYLRSSSQGEYAYSLNMNADFVGLYGVGQANASNLRCFKDVDTPIIDEPWIKVTFIANPADFIGWKFADWTTEKTINYQLMTWWYYQWPEEIQIPNLSGYMFEWWYTDPLLTTESRWTWLSTSTTYHSITLYAKYLPFNEKTQTWDWVTFTIMDRNLWATDYVSGYSYGIDNNPVSVRWNYYQWWNNFWFPTEWSYPNTLWLVLVKNYSDNQRWPGNYYFNGTFIKQSDRWDEEDNRNLWWWTWETQNIVNSDADKQWPCPAWYHVPSTYEWLASRNLFQKWQATEDWMEYCNFIHTTNKWIQYCMLAALGMPFAGYRNGSTSSTIDWGFSAHYWSSTAHSTKYAYRVDTNSSRLDPQYWDYRARAFPLRCFKNSDFLTLTFDSNWWSEVESQTWFKRWNPRDTAPTNPTKENVTFDGWYTDKELTQPFSFSNTTYISEDTTLYAKWNKPRCQNQWTQYSWVVWNCEEWTITVTNWWQSITMKDMNVWATEVWYWSSASTWSYWLYYQWWWSTWFTYGMNENSALNMWFLKDKNAWQTEFGSITDWGQGPCPTGYHVPTSEERSGLLTLLNGISITNISDKISALKLPYGWRGDNKPKWNDGWKKIYLW